MAAESRVAFVLSGGGSLGAVQVGMARALYERQIAPDFIVGTSAGALNGAYLSGHPATVATTDQLLELWRSLTRRTVFPISVLRGVMGLAGQRAGFVDENNLREFIETHAPYAKLEDARIPFFAIATDLLNGDEVVMSSGDTTGAIMASAAIPGVFPPVRRNGKFLVDGGVSNNTPISQAERLGATKIYVLPTGHACTLRTPPRSAVGVLMHAASLLVTQRLMVEVDNHDGPAELVVLPTPCEQAIPPANFSASQRLHDAGYRDAAAFLDARPAD